MSRIFAIGDVHGHYTELMGLYDKLSLEAKLEPSEDTLVFLGDYVDGGPDTKKVVNRIMEWKEKYPHWVFLFGNHEDLMIDALVRGGSRYHSFDLWYKQGGEATVDSYAPSNLTWEQRLKLDPRNTVSVDHLDFLATLPYFHETDDYIFVHAGIVPGMTPQEMRIHPALVKELLWIRDDFIESDYNWGKKVIFGHTFTNTPIVQKNKIGIDTLAKSYGSLTAVELPSEKFYHYPEPDFV